MSIPSISQLCRCLYVLSFCLWGILLSSQVGAQISYNHYTTAAGLPSNEVYSVFQDSIGYLWFGTDHGLVRYNGYRFETFTTADGLTDNTVFNIKQDQSGRIWFLTYNGGLCYYNGKGFHPHHQNDSIKKLFAKRLPTSWEIVGSQEHWMGFINMGIYKFGGNGIKLYIPSSAQTQSKGIYAINLANRQQVYTSFFNPITESLNASYENSAEYWPLQDQEVISHNFYFFPMTTGIAIVASLHNMVLLSNDRVLDKKKWPVQTRITSISGMADGTTWFTAKNQGAFQFEVCDGQLQIIDYLSIVNSPTGMYIDAQNNTWLTSLEAGVYMLPNKKIRLAVAGDKPVNESIASLLVTGNKLYAGLPENRYLVVDNNITARIEGKSNSSGPAVSLAWYQNRLLTNIDLRKIVDSSKVKQADAPYISELVVVDSTTILGGGTNGFFMMRNNQIIFRSETLGFTSRVTRMCQLANGTFAIGTHNGLYYFDVLKDSLWAEDTLTDVRINACKSINAEIYVVATRGMGVAIFIKGEPHFINQENGLVSNLAEDVYIQNDSIAWVATYKGLDKVRYELKGNRINVLDVQHYQKEDGLCSDEINAVTLFNGYIYLATNAGLCYFKPEDIVNTTYQVPIYFESMSANGESLSLDSLNLSPDQNNLVVRFNALYYKKQAKRYIARLNEGKWQAVNQNEIQYFNLPPGDYHLQIAADDGFGKYQSQVSTLSFYIAPKLIHTWYFKAFLLLALALSLLLITRAYLRYQRLRIKNQVRNLQSELKMLSYQINPHFIFNTLNSIQHYMLQKDSKYAVELLGSFSSLVRKIIFNSRKQYISVLEEVECLKEYMDLEKVRLEAQFDYEFNIDSNVNVVRNSLLPMIIQPIVENSIWHGIIPSLEKGKIIITFKNVNGHTLCVIEDDGIGIDSTKKQSKRKGSNLSIALDNVRERIKIVGELNNSPASITVNDKSTIGDERGTIVTILFPTIKHTDEKN